MRRCVWLVFFLMGCVESYDFSLKNENPQLVVEGFISDMSYEDSKNSPSDGRYFKVKLKYTRHVDETVSDSVAALAQVRIIDDLNNEWEYYEDWREWGTYYLIDSDFKAETGRKYKLQIITRDDEVFESRWETLPEVQSPEVGNIKFREYDKIVYEYPAGEQKIREEKVITVATELPLNTSGEDIFYRWEYTPMWVYEAPLATGDLSRYRKCWVTNQKYMPEYTFHEDYSGGYEQELFTLDIEKNERLYKNFSVLISQQSISKDYYFFWERMSDQINSNGIFDVPKANLRSNVICTSNPDKSPIGYFAVVSESSKRWYFNISDLSYFVQDDVLDECQVQYNNPRDPPDYAPECLVCLEYPKGKTTLVKPDWWTDK